MDNEFGSPVCITNKAIKWMFKLIPPQEEWVDCDISTAMRRFKIGNPIRVVSDDERIKDIFKEHKDYARLKQRLFSIALNEINAKWQYLKK